VGRQDRGPTDRRTGYPLPERGAFVPETPCISRRQAHVRSASESVGKSALIRTGGVNLAPSCDSCILAVPERSPNTESSVLHSVVSGTGPPLVLIHGVAGSLMVWERLAPLLEPHFTVIRMDLLGYGHSPKPGAPSTPRRHVAAIRRTLLQRDQAPPYVVVGLSMGANLMLEFAQRWPADVQDMIGIGFPYYPSEASARVGLRHNVWTRLALQYPSLARIIVPPVWSMARLTPGLLSGTSNIYTPAMARDALRANYRSFESSLLHCMVHYRLEEPLAASGARRRLFIHGGDDQWAAADVVREALAPFSDTEFHVVDAAPHNLVVAEPDRTAMVVLDYLQRG
jgi:pimeloyl-ACP methyl ester carboxylesterase